MKGKWKIILLAALLCASAAVPIGLAAAENGGESTTAAAEGAALFTAEKGAAVGGVEEVPDYMGDSYVGTREGVELTYSKNNAKVRFNGIIDLEELKGEPFIELQVTPENNLYKELNYLYLTLTDVYNENNYVTIRLMAGDATGMVYSQYTYVAAAPNGLNEPLGEVINAWGFGNTGAAMCTTFYGNRGVLTPQSLELSYNTEEDAVYGEKSDYWKEPKFCVIDFDDSRLGGIFSSFGGFTTGEVYLTIEAEGLAAAEGSVLIQSVNGYPVTELLEDSGETVISLNNGGNDVYDDAVKGGYYEVLPAIAYNRVTKLETPIVRVYYGDGKQPVPVRDGVFQTDNAGTYYIEYEATDHFVRTTRTLQLNVREEYEVPLSYEINPNIKTQAYLNDTIVLYNGTPSGGIGELTESISVKFGGTEQELIPNGKYQTFVPQVSGEYTVTFTVKDKVGGIVQKPLVITVSEQTAPAFEDPYLPKALIAGVPYTFPSVAAKFETASGSIDLKTEILIDGKDYAATPYTPTKDFTVTYKVSAVSDPSNSVEKSYPVAVRSSDTFDFGQYFYLDGVTGSVTNSGYLCTPTGDSGSIEFIKALPSESLNISMTVPEEQNNFDAITVTFIDALDAANRFTVRIAKSEVHNGYSDFYINGEFVSQINGDFYGNAVALTVRYDAETFALSDDMSKALGNVAYREDGAAFTGFSEYVYAVVGIEGAKGDAGVYIQRICNQSISSSVTNDNTAPIIVQETTLPFFLTASMGQEIAIGPAHAYDVLGSVTSCTLTVTDPEGAQLYSGAGDGNYTLKIEKVGTYKAIYAAQDSAGKTEEFTCRISVFDYTPPVITVGNIPDSVRVGDTIDIPAGEVHDESDDSVTLYRYMAEPMGYTRLITGETYTFTAAGNYTLSYYSVDRDGNYSIVSFEIKCRG